MTSEFNKSVVIIGASNDRRKFGNKAVRAYRSLGWTVYPVNPKERLIEDLRAYRALADVPRPVDRVSMYVPPAVGMTLLEDLAALEPDEVFFNPGSDSPEVIDCAKGVMLPVVAACSIVDIGLSPSQFPDA
ncbi:MAG TPA: CoA-binding protein [candidate division Zixibacteria bacterium]|jgi:predicted CoA-binding protein